MLIGTSLLEHQNTIKLHAASLGKPHFVFFFQGTRVEFTCPVVEWFLELLGVQGVVGCSHVGRGKLAWDLVDT